MIRVPHIHRITAAFAQLESYLKLNSGQGLNTPAGLAEDFCAPLLKHVYGYEFINVNAESKSAAGIDLLNRSRRLAVQVTVNDTTEKIRETHRSVPGSEFAAEFDSVILLFLVRKAPAEPQSNSKFSPCSTHTISSLDIDGLVSAIRGLEPSAQEQIAAFLEEEMGKPRWHQDTRISNLPFDSLGPLFIGREAFMGDLEKSLDHAASTVIKSVQAIHGMGGVGKTRAAIEYAWRHADQFHALLFVQADSPDALRRNLAALCAPAILNLPEHAATETDTQVAAVLAWLRKTPGWLLILDNIDSPETQAAVKQITTPLQHGKILITSRLAHWGTGFAALDLDVLSPEDSVKLLLDHTDSLRAEEPDEITAAAEIARLVDGLALALEQAAAHIRKTRCSFATYLVKWHAADARLREYQDRGIADYHAPLPSQHAAEPLPRSLWITFDASFSLLTPEARHLLQILSWLAPDPMPVAHLEALAAIPTATDLLCDLDDLHLVRRSDANHAFAVHRLIQEILRRQQPDAQPAPLQQALEWVNQLYQGDPNDVRTWDILTPLTPHAVSVATFAADQSIPEPTARLLSQAAVHLNACADHCAAELLMRRALNIDETIYGKNHPNVAGDLSNLAYLLFNTNRVAEAESMMRRALEINEASFGKEHPKCARSHKALALLLKETNRITESEFLMRRALEITDKIHSKEPLLCASILNNLALLLNSTGRHEEAEPMIIRALSINEECYGHDHPNVATSLSNLATILHKTKRLAEAEPLMYRALAIDEASYGKDHPNVAIRLNNLAQLLKDTNRLAEAEPLMRRALAIDEAIFGLDHPNVAGDLNCLAQLLQATNRLAQAEPLMRRHVEIFLKCSAANRHQHRHLNSGLDNYHQLLTDMGDTDEEALAKISALLAAYGLALG